MLPTFKKWLKFGTFGYEYIKMITAKAKYKTYFLNINILSHLQVVSKNFAVFKT